MRNKSSIACWLVVVSVVGCEGPGIDGELGNERFTSEGSDDFNSYGYPAFAPLAVRSSARIRAGSRTLASSDDSVLSKWSDDTFVAVSAGRAAVYAVDHRRDDSAYNTPSVNGIPENVTDFIWVHTETVDRLRVHASCRASSTCLGPNFAFIRSPDPNDAPRVGFDIDPVSASGLRLQTGLGSVTCNVGTTTGTRLRVELTQATAVVWCELERAHRTTFVISEIAVPSDLELSIEESELEAASAEVLEVPRRWKISASLSRSFDSLLWLPIRWTIDTPDTLVAITVDIFGQEFVSDVDVSECDQQFDCTFRRLADGPAFVRVEVPGTDLVVVHEVNP